jgi:hypothetical protein
MRLSRGGRANRDECRARDVDDRDRRQVDDPDWGCNSRRAATRAEAGAVFPVLLMMIGRCAVLVGSVNASGDGVMTMNRARVEAPRVEERGLKPESPERHESA